MNKDSEERLLKSKELKSKKEKRVHSAKDSISERAIRRLKLMQDIERSIGVA